MLETNNDIQFANNNEIPLEEVITQMEKEIQMSGEQYTFSCKQAGSLVKELSLFLKQIDCGNRVENLFYRIDIDPTKKDRNIPHYESLSTLAWNRVFRKVWFRREFKTGNI